MLPPAHRLRSRPEFSAAVRVGRRASRPLLTVHLQVGPGAGSSPARAGLVVSRAVGGSVVRHRVARRLRHQLREVIRGLPAGSNLVVRASPSSAQASSADLGADLRAALDRVTSVPR